MEVAEKGNNSSRDLSPKTLLSTEEISHIQHHKVFQPKQLAELKRQIAQFEQINHNLREARRITFLQQIKKNKKKKEPVSGATST
mmetsp:Transcript_10298/g.24546  ORF Transcript_10298/g.24546 Transcript_10298/m.24546 type:complete len:85 (-) Transcript_10298:242-496(-)